MVLLLSAAGDDPGLMAEAGRGGLSLQAVSDGLLTVPRIPEPLPPLAAVRQAFPHARQVEAASIGAWALLLAEAVDSLPEDRWWQLHVAPHYGVQREVRMGARARHTASRRGHLPKALDGPTGEGSSVSAHAGAQRCSLIRQSLLERLRERRRHRWRHLRPGPEPFGSEDSLVQLLLTSPTAGWLSVSQAPEPWQLRRWVSPFPNGDIPVASDRSAPSRAFAKLVEAELRFGRRIAPGEICVDLGASPGGWTWVARQRGASVVAVDRSPLRDDLMADPLVRHVQADAFRFEPDRPVDWLVCDVIAAPERSIDLVLAWARHGWARNFVVTIKLRDGDSPKLERLKCELPSWSDEWFLTHLCANKHEACVFGTVRA